MKLTLTLCLLLQACAAVETLYYINECGLDPYRCNIQQPQPKEQQ